MSREVTTVVGMLIPDSTNQFFSMLAQLIQRELEPLSRAVIIMDSDGSRAKEQSYLAALRKMEVSGMIFVSGGDSPEAYRYLEDWRPPLLVLDREIPGMENADFVIADGEEGVRQVIEHLRSLGHHRIGIINGAQNTAPGRDRSEAFEKACTQHGVEVRDAWRFNGNFHFRSGRAAAQRLLDISPTERPTAIFAANDLMAMGLVQGLQERGVVIPKDLSVVGFDDIPMASWLHPALTTVQQDVLEMARLGAELLDERLRLIEMNGDKSFPDWRVRVTTPRLVARSSCGRAPD